MSTIIVSDLKSFAAKCVWQINDVQKNLDSILESTVKETFTVNEWTALWNQSQVNKEVQNLMSKYLIEVTELSKSSLQLINEDAVIREANKTKAIDKMKIEEDLKLSLKGLARKSLVRPFNLMDFYKDLDDKWFDNMISGATASQETPIAVKDRDGNDLQIKITNAVIEYMIANRFMILKVGKDTFKQFLLLCSDGQDLVALKLIYSNMDTTALINQYKENAVKLAEIYKQDQDTKAFWLQMATTLGGKLISLALGSII